MMNEIRQRLEDWMAAVAFAEQGDHLTARQLVRGKQRPMVAPRKRAIQRDRMAARARLSRD
jgi:hypothetical protein